MTTERYGDTCFIVYNDKEAWLQIQYHGAKPTKPRLLKPGALPVLLFQLVDAGYVILQDESPRGMRVLTACSASYASKIMAEDAKDEP